MTIVRVLLLASIIFSVSTSLHAWPVHGAAPVCISYPASPFYQSLAFTDSWIAQQSTLSTNALPSPACANTAANLVEDGTASTQHQIVKIAATPALAAVPYNLKFYARRNVGARNIIPTFYSSDFVSANANIGTNLSNCTASFPASASGSFTNGYGNVSGPYTINGQSWCQVSLTMTGVVDPGGFALILTMADGTNTTYSGDGTSSIALWGLNMWVPDIYDNFVRANGAIGNAQSGQTYQQVPAAGNVTLATISSNTLVAADTGQPTTAAYSGIDLGSGNVTAEMHASFSITTGADGCTVALISNPNGLSSVSDITTRSLHVIFNNGGWKAQIWDATQIPPLIDIATGNYSVPLIKDSTTVYNVGWNLTSNSNTITLYMPDNSTVLSTDARYAAFRGRYSTAEHFFPNAGCQPIIRTWSAKKAANDNLPQPLEDAA